MHTFFKFLQIQTPLKYDTDLETKRSQTKQCNWMVSEKSSRYWPLFSTLSSCINLEPMSKLEKRYLCTFFIFQACFSPTYHSNWLRNQQITMIKLYLFNSCKSKNLDVLTI